MCWQLCLTLHGKLVDCDLEPGANLVDFREEAFLHEANCSRHRLKPMNGDDRVSVKAAPRGGGG